MTYLYPEVFAATQEYFSGNAIAASVFVDKYALRFREGNEWRFVEKTPDDMHHRLAREIARIEQNYPNPVSEEELFEAFRNFGRLVPQGSPMYGIGNPYVLVSLSNCVVTESPKDSISGIFDIAKDLANLEKRRCGVGINISTLRPDGTLVNNSAGTSTGCWSFADKFSYDSRKIAQNGRRGALMLTLHVGHPDIDHFILMKRDRRQVTGANVSILITRAFMDAVRKDEDWLCKWPVETDTWAEVEECSVEDVLLKGGYWAETKAGEIPNYWVESVMSPEGEEVERISHSNPLWSKTWVSLDPKEKRGLKIFRARELWHLINDCAVNCAEPGLLFWDNYAENLPANCYPEFRLVCVNPCSEIGLSPNDSCRLLALNLLSYVRNPFTKDSYFDFEAYYEDVRLAMRVMDDIVDLEIEALTKIIEKCDDEDEKTLWGKLRRAAEQGRRTGLGNTAVADMLIALGLAYDSEEAIQHVEEVFRIFAITAYEASSDLAVERGSFPQFSWEIEKDCAFIKRLPEILQEKIAKQGRRNISLLTEAPYGSVSLETQTESGIEPMFRAYSGRLKKINPSDTHSRVDYTDDLGDRWTFYEIWAPSAKRYIEAHPEVLAQWEEIKASKNPNTWADEMLSILPDYFVTSDKIDPRQRVRIQGVIQKWIDHGISSTINMPRGTTVEQGMELYDLAEKNGLKGVTIYVDGSRSGVLQTKIKKEEPERVQDVHAPKRPQTLSCDVHHTTVQGQRWTILVGLMGDRPYEIFGGEAGAIELPRRITRGQIRREKVVRDPERKSRYDLILEDTTSTYVVDDIVNSFNNVSYANETRQISALLRHGMPLASLVEMLQKDKNRELFSFSRVMARVIKRYIKDGTQSKALCEECGEPLVFEGGCVICKACGKSSKCD